jgi:hypothetical protein
MRKTAFLIFLLLSCLSQYTLIAQGPLKPRDPSITGPQTFAIIMGVSKYKFVRPLAYAHKDAEMFRDYLKSPGGGSVKEENVFCLLNEEAINSNFWSKGFQWLRAKQLRKGDKLFIYLAGHGDAIDEDQFFFLSYDCNPNGDKNNYLVAGTIQLYNLKKKIAAETAKGVEVVFIMDACRSSELPGGTSGQSFLNSAISEKKVGEIIMLATGAGQESLEDASIGTGHGLFTYYLVDGLSGVADNIGNPDNKVSFQEIKTYVDQNVPSVAQQRFRRKQDPFFCCNENSDKVISVVDTAYLSKWLKLKKQQNRGGGNSFNGLSIPVTDKFEAVDTLLIETYNRFYLAVKSKKIAGNGSAEDYFSQLTKKFPGNPYTLDAKTTLAVEYINEAQARVDEYLSCTESTAKQKQANYQAGLRLEKAIAILNEEDPDFANSLRGRMYLLKASGDHTAGANNGDIAAAFQNAYSALAIDRNGAYIQNELALLHLENNRLDSAAYYAEKATNTAPKWNCTLVTLALIRKNTGQQPNQNKPGDPTGKKPIRKSSFGGVAGGGISQLNPGFAGTRNTNFIGVNPRDIIKADLGIIYQLGISNNISIRPTALVSIEGGDLVYDRRLVTGGQIFHDTVKLKNTSISIAVPVIFHLSNKKIAPFISIGPSFSYILSQDATSSELVPVKKSVLLGDAGLGVDIQLGKSRLILSPELKYTQGFNNQKETGTTGFSDVLSSLKKRGITLSVYLRGR